MVTHKQCPIAIFYRAGHTPLMPMTLDKLLLTFAKYGYKSFAVDMSSGASISLAKKHQAIADSYKKIITDIIEVNSFSSDQKLHSLTKSGLFSVTVSLRTEQEKLEAIDEIKISLIKLYDESASMAKLFKDLAKSDLKYAPIGKETIDIFKDVGYEYVGPVIKFFADWYSYFTGAQDPFAFLNRDITEFDFHIEKIQALCDKDQAPIVAYFGLSFFEMAKALKAEGNQVQEFYIVDYPPDFSPYQGNGIDGKLRTNQYDHNIEIIDLDKNPRFNPLKIVKDSMIDYSDYNSGSEL